MRLPNSIHWAIWIGLALTAVSCKKGPPPLAQVSELRLSQAGITSHPWLDLSPRALLNKGQEALRGTGRIQVEAGAAKADGSTEPWQALLEVSHVRSLPPGHNESKARADVGVLITLSRGRERLRGEGAGESSFSSHDPKMRGEAFEQALQAALDEASRLIVLQLEAAEKSDEELIADLGTEDPLMRDLSVRLLTERKSVAAVPHLVERLSDSDRGIQLRVIGALVEIGDPAAAPALIDATTQRDPAFVLQVVYALGELGGEDAEAFLFTASTGHPEAAVRRGAMEALKQLRSRSEGPSEQTRR